MISVVINKLRIYAYIQEKKRKEKKRKEKKRE